MRKLLHTLPLRGPSGLAALLPALIWKELQGGQVFPGQGVIFLPSVPSSFVPNLLSPKVMLFQSQCSCMPVFHIFQLEMH